MIRILLVLAFFGNFLIWPESVWAQGEVSKPVVAVAKFGDPTNSGQSQTLKIMVETAITETGKFRIIERDFSALDAEQNLARAGRVTTNRPGKSGGFEGVDYVVYGTITSTSGGEVGDSGADTGRALMGGLLGVSLGGGCRKSVAIVAVDVKIVNTVTGEIRFAKQITERAEGATSCSGSNGFDTTSLMRGVANQTASGLTITMFPIKVASVQADGTFVLNYGSGTLAPGTVLVIYDQGEAIVDPDTGAVLTSEGVEVGQVEVTEVTTRFSRARPLTPFSLTPPNGSVARVLEGVKVNPAKKRR